MARIPWRSGRLGLAAAGLALLPLLAGCGSGQRQGSAAGNAEPSVAEPSLAEPSGGQPSVAEAPTPGGMSAASSGPAHVVVAVFENKDEPTVMDSGKAPYLTSLAATGTTFTNAHGITHPSQPNYLALFSGSTQGVTDDSCLDQMPGDNLGNQLRAAGLSFVGYAEGLPREGYTGCDAGDYARKHNPWVDFSNLPASVNQPLSAMPSDYAQLPTVAIVVPDMCHSMHDCGIAAGDAWAKQVLDPYVSWARRHDSVLIVTFDEDEGSSANHIPTFVVGAGVPATTSDQPIDHYGLLRSLEDMYGLPPLGEAAAAQPITALVQTAGR